MGGFSTLYVPGAWVAVAGKRTWVLAALEPDSSVIGELWELLRGGSDVFDVLDVLIDGGMRTAPSFAIAHIDDETVTVILRGKGRAIARAESQQQHLGADLTMTWVEHRISSAIGELQLGGDEAIDGSSLPVSGGVVRASMLAVVFDDGTDVERPSSDRRPPSRVQAIDLSIQPDSPDLRTGGGFAPATAEGSEAIPVSLTQVYKLADEATNISLNDESEQSRGMNAILELPVPEADDSDNSGYDHLFGMTVNREVEDAAVRSAQIVQVDLAKPLPPITSAQPAAAVMPAPPPVGETPIVKLPLSATIIDRVPWLVAPTTKAPPGTKPIVFRPPIPTPHDPNTESDSDSNDGDGMTISRKALNEQLRQISGGPVPYLGPTVQAVSCSSGHPNPVHAVTCRSCRADVPAQTPITLPRPVVGVLRMSTGDVITLDRSVLLGRSPSADRLVDGEKPHLVKVPSPTKDISRNHVEVRLDGWQVLVVDLNSMNGTMVTLPGRPTERLRPDVAVAIEPGAVVSLADEVTFSFEVLQ